MATPSFSVEDLLGWLKDKVDASVINSDLYAGDIATARFKRPALLSTSKADEVAYFFSKDYLAEVPTALPSVLVTGIPFVEPLRASGLPLLKKSVVIAASDPYRAMAIISGYLAESLSTVAHQPAIASPVAPNHFHPSAVIDPSAQIGSGVSIAAFCVVERGVKINDGSVLYPSVFLGPNAQLGRDCVLFPNVVIYEETIIGDRARIHANTVIGSDGFGYAPIMTDGLVSGHEKIYHFGKVIIGDDVEIGAGVLIDRGTIGNTRIDSKVKLDNQVHIGHNCTIEEGAILCGCVSLAGGSRVGKYVYMGGMSAVGGGSKVGDRAKVGAMSGVGEDVPPGKTVFGIPARDHRSFFRIQSLLNRMLEEYESKKRNKRLSHEKNSADPSG